MILELLFQGRKVTVTGLDLELFYNKYGSEEDICHYNSWQNWLSNFHVCCGNKTVEGGCRTDCFSEIQEVIYFPTSRTKAVSTVGSQISSDSGEAPDWSVCLPMPVCIHACPSAQSCLLPGFETAVTPEQSGEMISQLLTDLIPSVEMQLQGALEQITTLGCIWLCTTWNQSVRLTLA